MADLTITNVSAPLAVLGGSSFTIDVSVTAAPDAFVEGSAYRLFIQVHGSNHDQVIPLKGHLQDTPWTTPSHVFSVPVIAGAAPDLYHVHAALMEGPSGIDPNIPTSFGSASPIVIV